MVRVNRYVNENNTLSWEFGFVVIEQLGKVFKGSSDEEFRAAVDLMNFLNGYGQ